MRDPLCRNRRSTKRCASTPKKWQQWTAAALRAHITRTRATMDRPKAEVESNRLQALLAAEPRAGIALADRLAEVERLRGETASEFASLMSVAREQTEEDRAKLSRLEQELQRLDLERQLLSGLEGRPAPVPPR